MKKKSHWLSLLCFAAFVNPDGSAQEVREPNGNYPADRFNKVAVIQFSPPGSAPVDVSQSTVDRYKERTIQSLESQIREAAENGALLVVTPEFGTVGYPDIPDLPDEEDEFQNRAQIKPYVEEVDGPTFKRFAKLSKELGIWLVVGIAEVEKSSDRYYNTLIAINPKGKMVTSYRKIHLFEGEHDFLSAGSQRKYFDTPFGRVGMFTCYDIHFQEPAVNLVEEDGATIIAFSTSWVGENGMSTFQNFARQNEVYFLAANHIYFPDSGVVEPNGTKQSHIRSLDGPAYGYIPKLKKKARKMPARKK